MGSQIALCAARSGIGSWRIIDPDFLLPHNLARHVLLRSHVGMTKAEGLAAEIRELLGVGSASSHASGILEASREPDVLGGADLVLDCSAALPVARWLSAGPHSGRTVSAFLNPTGSDLVLMWEGAERRPRLTCLEMTYYWSLVGTAALAKHLSPGISGIYPAGGCRSPSLRIPQSRLATFSGIATERLLEGPLPAAGGMEIWTRTADGIVPFRFPPLDFEEARAGEWLLFVEAGVLAGVRQARRLAGGLETGGILVGCFDRPRKHAYVVAHYDPPPDSVAGPASFVRGLVGVHRTLEDVETATLGNLTYVGEWHTHPAPASSHPSADDSKLLTWIEDALAFSDLPPVMLIAGEGDIRVIIGDVGIPALFATNRPGLGGEPS